jgi:hypothetical protein
MLTPMLVQYLVGLCCFRRHNPDAVGVIVGDLVLDVAARKRRDVDVTVTVKEEDGTVTAFKGYEVKHEGRPLNVEPVEQLCGKLRDMPNITHRAIVSMSRFTESTINKAVAYNVDLFQMKPWTESFPENFPVLLNAGTPQDFFRSVESTLLCWVNQRLHFHVPSLQNLALFQDNTEIYNNRSKPHKKYRNVGELNRAILMRSTEILLQLEPAQTVFRTKASPSASGDTICGGGMREVDVEQITNTSCSRGRHDRRPGLPDRIPTALPG